MKPGTEALSALPPFARAEPAVLVRLNEIADLARFGPDEVLFQAGQMLKELSVLAAGQVGATSSKGSSLEAFVDVILPVRALCLPSVLLGRPASIGARTLTSARVIIFPIDELQALIQDCPAIGLALLDHALDQIQDLTVAICDLKLRTSVQCLGIFLLSLVKEPDVSPARFVLPFEKRFLAARIGCSQENLSRAFVALRKFGVETRNGVVVLRDLAALRGYCEQP